VASSLPVSLLVVLSAQEVRESVPVREESLEAAHDEATFASVRGLVLKLRRIVSASAAMLSSLLPSRRPARQPPPQRRQQVQKVHMRATATPIIRAPITEPTTAPTTTPEDREDGEVSVRGGGGARVVVVVEVGGSEVAVGTAVDVVDDVVVIGLEELLGGYVEVDVVGFAVVVVVVVVVVEVLVGDIVVDVRSHTAPSLDEGEKELRSRSTTLTPAAPATLEEVRATPNGDAPANRAVRAGNGGVAGWVATTSVLIHSPPTSARTTVAHMTRNAKHPQRHSTRCFDD
jgi:hypothetical protein